MFSLEKINLDLFGKIQEPWLQQIGDMSEDFPTESYKRRLEYINPVFTKTALSNDYALLEGDLCLATAAITHVGPKSPQGYIKVFDILLAPRLAALSSEIDNTKKAVSGLLLASLQLSEGEMRSQTIKIYGGSSESFRIFAEIVEQYHSSQDVSPLVEALGVKMGQYGAWLEIVKLQHKA